MLQLCIVFSIFAWATAQTVDVQTDLGTVRGTTLKTRLGADFQAFRGIRYAKPPIGDLRFKAPQPADAWKPKTFDAIDDGPICPQGNLNSSEYSEDCLCLNVYTKNLQEKTLRPVIIYLHPGGFYAASGHSRLFAGPQFFMDRDIVLVTINYRLGTLGFLATGTLDAPGNAGLKDQVMAFKWVRDHISNFGGDPNSVTLWGYSAGSLSIGLHMASPMSQGLFHKGIAMSASAVSQWQYAEDQLDLAQKQARLVNCPTNTVTEMMKCLKETPTDEFVRTMPAMFTFGYNPVLNWMPVIEKNLGQERFMIEDPTKAFQAGRIQRIPLITGMTEDEFVHIAHGILKNETQTQELNENWQTLAPICFQYERNTPRSRQISDVLRKEYLDNKPLTSPGPFEPLGKLFSDGLISFGVHRFAHLAARFMPVHYYRFSYKGRYSFFYYPEEGKPFGTVHHDELLYLLYIRVLTPSFSKTDPENAFIERLTRMWAKFAETGDPNNSNDEYLKNINWDQFSLKKENYLDIGNDLVMKKGLYLERFAIWKRLFPLDWHGVSCRQSDAESPDYPEPI